MEQAARTDRTELADFRAQEFKIWVSEGRLGSGTKRNRAPSPEALEQQRQIIGCGLHSCCWSSDC